MLDYVLIGIAVMALLGVVFEEVLHVNKAKTTLFFGTFAWILLFIDANRGPHLAELNEHLIENISEISTLWLFLVAAMTFVAAGKLLTVGREGNRPGEFGTGFKRRQRS